MPKYACFVQVHSTKCNTRPRTKQTAKKSTGATAPSVSLSDLQPSQPKKRKIHEEENSVTVLSDVGAGVELKEQVEVLCSGGPVEHGMVRGIKLLLL